LPLAERQAKNDACAVCHMPRRESSDISHTAVTDHRILRRPAVARANRVPASDDLPIRLYHASSRHGPSPEERERDMGVGLAFLVQEKENRKPLVVKAAVERLLRATERYPGDVVAWESLAYVLAAQGKWTESLQAVERALTVDPGREASLQHGTIVALQLGKPDRAIEYARRAVEINPGSPVGHVNLGLALMESRDWMAAAGSLQDGLKEMPGNAGARAALAVCLFQLGNEVEARVEIERAIVTAPEQALALREWYGRRTR
jgi:tetratricopeptide (TPR) repeat protein